MKIYGLVLKHRNGRKVLVEVSEDRAYMERHAEEWDYSPDAIVMEFDLKVEDGKLLRQYQDSRRRLPPYRPPVK